MTGYAMMHDNGSPDIHIGYVLARFPVLSETFIIRELLALQDRGIRISIYAFGADTLSTPHEVLKRITAPVIYLPPRRGRGRVLGTVFHWMTRTPLNMISVLRGAGSSESLRTCLGATYLAYRARENPPHHIHVHFISSPSAAAFTMARLLGVTFSVTAHAHDIFLTPRDELRNRIHQAAWVRTISRFNRRVLREIAPRESRKIEVIRAGIDPGRFPYEPKDRDSGDPIHIVSVGRLVEIKGMDTLIDSLTHLSDIPVILSIAGDGPLKSSLMSRADKRGVASRINWLGPQSERAVADLLSDADIFILASKQDAAGNMDGIPVVLMEALSRGVPVISTSVSGIPELLGGGAGIIVPPCNAEAIAAAVRVLHADHQTVSRIRRSGRHRIERGYDIRKTTGYLVDRFSRLSKQV